MAEDTLGQALQDLADAMDAAARSDLVLARLIRVVVAGLQTGSGSVQRGDVEAVLRSIDKGVMAVDKEYERRRTP